MSLPGVRGKRRCRAEQKLVHHGSILWRNGILSIVIGMEVEEIKNHELHSTADAFFVKHKSGGIVAVFHPLKILKA